MFFFLLTFVIFISQSLFGLTIAFVHLGKNVPKSLFAAIKQARTFNEQEEIYLLADEEAFFQFQKNKSFF